MEKELLKEKLKMSLPVLVFRNAIGEILPGWLSAKTLSNIDSQEGGLNRIKVGRRIAYERDNFIDWLIDRMTVV